MHKSNLEFRELLDVLGWNTSRTATSLETSPQNVECWADGRYAVPDRILRVMRKYHQIYNPGASPPPSPSPGSSSNPRIENPHMNWHQPSPEASISPAHTPEVERLKEQVRELEEQLLRLRRSYKELGQENERLREQVGDQNRDFGPYAVLGVTPGSDWSHIKAAYLRLSQKFHPDRGGDVQRMQQITEAYTELKLIYA